MPAKGDQPHLECSWDWSMDDVLRMSNIAKSASLPTSIEPLFRPNHEAAFEDPIRATSSKGTVPLAAILIAIGTVVSTPGMPPGASPNSASFSSTVCGAWSLPNIFILPLTNSSKRPRRVSFVLSGGLTLPKASLMFDVSRSRWCMVTSVENPAASAMPTCSALVQWHMLILTPLYTESLRMALYSASTGRLRRWSRQECSGSFDIRESSSAWTLTGTPDAAILSIRGAISESSLRSMLPVVEPMKSLNDGICGASCSILAPGVRAA